MIRRYSFAGLMLLVNLFLIWPSFFPTAEDIGMWDEAAYLHKGQVLLDQGTWPVLAENPLTSVFYALTYLPFRTSKVWLLQSDGLGRLLCFILVWAATWLVARQIQIILELENQPEGLRRQAWLIPPVMLGFVLCTPLITDMFPFPSDALFTGLSGLSFWQLLAYLNSGAEPASRRSRHVWAASALLGLTALARNDGLVLFPILVLLVGIINWPLRLERRWWLAVAGAVLPFFLLVGGYLLIYGALTGQYSPGTAERTYENFEAGQGVVYEASGAIESNVENLLEARRVFGTPEENGYSVFNAIRRNPQAYVERLKALLLALPTRFLHAYGIRFAAVLLILTLCGVASLVRGGLFRLLAVFVLWSLHLASGLLITLIREGHLRFIFFIIFALAAIGLAVALEDWANSRLRTAWMIVLATASAVSFLDNKLAIFYGLAAFLLALVAAWMILRSGKADPEQQGSTERYRLSAGLLAMLCAGLVLHGSFPGAVLPDQAQGARIESVIYLSEHFPPGTPVAASAPGPVWMAKMNYLGLAAADVPRERTPEEFLTWMKLQGIEVVYVDSNLYHINPAIWRMIEPQVGQGLELVETFGEGDIQILVVK